METEFLIIRIHVPFFNEKNCPPLLRQLIFGSKFLQSIIVPCKEIIKIIRYHISRYRGTFFLPANSIQVIMFVVVLIILIRLLS